MKYAKLLVSSAIAGLLFTGIARSAPAAIEPRSILKTFFETGDVPTQDQFRDLIDSFLNYNDDHLTITGIASDPNPAPGAASLGGRKFEDDSIDSTLSYAAIGGPGEQIPLMSPEFSGHSGFLGLRLADSAGTHYGYFQLSMDDSLLVSPPGIHVDYFVFNSTPDAPLTIQSVPEPASLLAFTLPAALLALRRRRH